MRRLILSSEHRQYKQVAGLLLKSLWRSEPIKTSYENQLAIEYDVYLPDKRRDGSNIEKILKDTLSKIVYDDDKWVCMRLMKIYIDKNNPRVELTI